MGFKLQYLRKSELYANIEQKVVALIQIAH